MKTEYKIIIGLLSVLVVVLVAGMFKGDSGKLGYVGDTTAFNSSMVLNSIAATTTLAIGGDSVGKLCVKNPTNFSIITFGANSTSTTIATSTTCPTN